MVIWSLTHKGKCSSFIVSKAPSCESPSASEDSGKETGAFKGTSLGLNLQHCL